MRSTALAFLLVCLGLAPFTSRAATCEHPAAPSADRDPAVFFASFLADPDLRDLYPLCGHPKVAVIGGTGTGAVTLFEPVTYTYRFDKEGRPLSRDIGGAKDTYIYDASGRLVEIRTVNHKGDITGRQVFTWSSPYEYTSTTLREDGAPKWTPAHGALDVARRTLVIRAGDDVAVHEFDENWNHVSIQGEPVSFMTERDAKGRQQSEWKITATGGKQPMARYHYFGSDARGNPTALTEDFAVTKYGILRWASGEKKAVRVVEYW